jgi:hypothetical protein
VRVVFGLGADGLVFRAERRPREERVQVLVGEHRAEDDDGGQGEAPIAERRLQSREADEDAHRPDPPAGRALAEVEDLEAIGPERGVACLEVGAARVELGEVEQEVHLDLPLLAGELGEAQGEGV